jgi:hypothetical protein
LLGVAFGQQHQSHHVSIINLFGSGYAGLG